MRVGGASSNLYAAMVANKTTLPAVDRSVAASGSGTAPAITDNKKSFDFSSATPQQMQQSMRQLLQTGQMSPGASSALASMIPTSLNKVSLNGRSTNAYQQPADYIARLEIGIESAKTRNDRQSVQQLSEALHVLKRLQGTPQGLDIQA